MLKKILFIILFIALLLTTYLLYTNRRTVPYVETIKEQVINNEAVISGVIKSYFFDFENKGAFSTNEILSGKHYYSQKNSLHIPSSTEDSPAFFRKLSELGNVSGIGQISLNLNFYSEKKIEKAKAVISITDSSGKPVEWLGTDLKGEADQWHKLSYSIYPNKEILKPDNILKIYFWNIRKEDFYVDDLKIEVSGLFLNETAGNALAFKNTNFAFDFEEETSSNANDEFFHSGKKSFYFDASQEFGPVLTHVIGDMCDDTMRYISASVWVYPLENDPDFYIVATMDDKDGKQLEWKGRTTQNLHFKKGKWKKLLVKLFENYPNEIKTDNSIKVYLWNKSKSKLYVDDFEISIGCNLTHFGNGAPVDMTTHRFDSVLIPKNKYPLPISYLVKENIGTSDAVFLTPDNKGKLLPNEIIFTGNFIADNNSTDELLQITKENKLNLFTYCEDKNTFVFASETKTNLTNLQCAFVKGSFTSSSEQLICIDKSLKKIFEIQFTANNSNLCSLNGANVKISEINFTSDESNLLFNKDNLFVASNVLGDAQTEIVLFDTHNNRIFIYACVGTNLTLKENIALSNLTVQLNRKFACTALPPQNGFDKLLITTEGNSQTILLEYEAGKKNFKSTDISAEAKDFVHASDIILPGNWQTGNNILSFSQTWRNEFKLMNLGNTNFTVSALLDFTNYADNKNPKFYETLKVLPFSKGKNKFLSLLTIMYNCVDENYSGGKCNLYESINEMPNAIELFKF